MLLPEVTVAFFAFWVTMNSNQELSVKMIQDGHDYYKFKNPVPIDQLPAVKESLGDSLVFGDKYVKVNKNLFKIGFDFEIDAKKQQSHVVAQFEYFDLVVCLPRFEDEMLELSQNEIYSNTELPKVIESYSIAKEEFNLKKPKSIQVFDINESDPEEWIQIVELKMKKVRADPEKYGKQVLSFLLEKQSALWLKEEIKQNPSITWISLTKSFVDFVRQWQSKETELSPLPNELDEPLEEQIENKLRLLEKKLSSVSVPDLRMLTYKLFPNNSVQNFIPQYGQCSEKNFVRALRLKYEQQFVENKINPAVGLKLLTNLHDKHIKVQPFDEINDDPSIWIQNVENEFSNLNANLNSHGIYALAYLLNGPALQWYIDFVNNTPAISWDSMFESFNQHFKQYQIDQKDKLMVNYKEDEDVEQFIANKLRLWKNMSSSVPSKEVQAMLSRYFEEPKRSLIEKIAFFDEKDFLVGCRLAFDKNY